MLFHTLRIIRTFFTMLSLIAAGFGFCHFTGVGQNHFSGRFPSWIRMWCTSVYVFFAATHKSNCDNKDCDKVKVFHNSNISNFHAV